MKKCEHLGFLTLFMSQLRVNCQEVANKSGYSRQNIHNLISNDDAKISTLYKIFNSYGYNLEFAIIDSNNNTFMNITNKPNCKCTFQLKETDKRKLSFLSDAMYEFPEFCPKNIEIKANIPVANLQYWIKVDDCKISEIYKMLKPFNLILHCNIFPQENQL